MDTKGLQKEFINWCKANKKSPKSEQETKLLFVSFMKEKHPEEYKAAVENLKKQQLQQAQKAAHGAKLNYFKSLKNQCAEDEEVVYYKKGGSVGCGCKKKEDGGQVNIAQKGSVIDKFKQTYKKATESVKSGIQKEIKKKSTEGNFRTIPVNRKQVEEGKKLNKDNSKLQLDNALRKGGEIKKNCGGAAVKAFKAAKCGSKLKKHLLGGSLNRIPFMLAGTSKGGLPTAPKAQNRYKGAYVFKNGSGYIDNDIRYSNYPTTRIVSNVPYNMTPAIITESIVAPGDTLYTEIPEQKRFSLRGLPVERKASTKNPKGQEKNILQRRFREALSVANPNALHWFFK